MYQLLLKQKFKFAVRMVKRNIGASVLYFVIVIYESMADVFLIM